MIDERIKCINILLRDCFLCQKLLELLLQHRIADRQIIHALLTGA